jgi:hypothetical protein
VSRTEDFPDPGAPVKIRAAVTQTFSRPFLRPRPTVDESHQRWVIETSRRLSPPTPSPGISVRLSIPLRRWGRRRDRPWREGAVWVSAALARKQALVRGRGCQGAWIAGLRGSTRSPLSVITANWSVSVCSATSGRSLVAQIRTRAG